MAATNPATTASEQATTAAVRRRRDIRVAWTLTTRGRMGAKAVGAAWFTGRVVVGMSDGVEWTHSYARTTTTANSACMCGWRPRRSVPG